MRKDTVQLSMRIVTAALTTALALALFASIASANRSIEVSRGGIRQRR